MEMEVVYIDRVVFLQYLTSVVAVDRASLLRARANSHDKMSDEVCEAESSSSCSESHMDTLWLDTESMAHRSFDFKALVSLIISVKLRR